MLNSRVIVELARMKLVIVFAILFRRNTYSTFKVWWPTLNWNRFFTGTIKIISTLPYKYY